MGLLISLPFQHLSVALSLGERALETMHPNFDQQIAHLAEWALRWGPWFYYEENRVIHYGEEGVTGDRLSIGSMGVGGLDPGPASGP